MEQAIIDALVIIGPATARQVESYPAVKLACQQSKLKARHRLDAMMLAGRVQSDRVGQGATFWVEAKVTEKQTYLPVKPGGLDWRLGNENGRPLISFREAAEEFGVSLGVLRYAMREPGSPNAVTVKGGGLTSQNSWYDPEEMRKWWLSR